MFSSYYRIGVGRGNKSPRSIPGNLKPYLAMEGGHMLKLLKYRSANIAELNNLKEQRWKLYWVYYNFNIFKVNF